MESTQLARLRRVTGKQTTTLTHIGRKTGKPHQVTIWLVRDRDRLSLHWHREREPPVGAQRSEDANIRLSMASESFDGNARFLIDRAEHEQAMTAIRRKYWMFRPIIELGRLLAALGVMRDNTGSFEVTLAS